MHELAVTENILNIATKHALRAQASKVTDIHIVIGALSSIVDDSVQFYWDIVSKDTICEGSKLHFKRILAELICLDCGKTYKIKADLTPCPKCNSQKVKITKGDEFYMDSIEVNRTDSGE